MRYIIITKLKTTTAGLSSSNMPRGVSMEETHQLIEGMLMEMGRALQCLLCYTKGWPMKQNRVQEFNFQDFNYI